jgi:hypothetical protein
MTLKFHAGGMLVFLTTLPGETVTQTDKTDREIKQSVVQIFQYMPEL